MIIHNKQTQRLPYNRTLRKVLSIEKARESRQWLSYWREGIYEGYTPLWNLPGLAHKLGVANISIKDESKRSWLRSFKALGAPVALVRLILRCYPEKQFQPEHLFAGKHAEDLKDFVVISATDGNHGRALAAAAKSMGCQCVIVLHSHVSIEREQPIAELGAEIIRIEGNYDKSVEEAARLAEKNKWHVVSDTSYEGYEEIPRDVMQGYAIIADEICEQMPVNDTVSSAFTHIFLQGGVGGLAAGIISYFTELYGEKRPIFIIVEPRQADCLFQSAIKNYPAQATGTIDSMMAGLACGQTSPLAWLFLKESADFFTLVEDEDVSEAMRILAQGCNGDVPIIAGESGVAGLVSLQNLIASETLRKKASLDATSSILLINTEGDTAPAIYEKCVGRSAASVQMAQTEWLTKEVEHQQ